ncbi:recombinase family protein [Streptomyces nitrosporeus]|uniref:recombinase family protein n=1 Tax=Streptomyces nitrosporeus TaxID=28894 RepID=UPI0033217B3A
MNESIDYARCSLDEQDLTARRGILPGLGIAGERVHPDHGLTGTNRGRPGPARATAAAHACDPLVVPAPERLARSAPVARGIGDSSSARGVKLSLDGALHGPGDPMDKMFFHILGTFAGFEAGLLRMRTREGTPVAKAEGKPRGKQVELTKRQQTHPVKGHRSGERTIAGLTGLSSVGRAAVHRVLERHRTSVAPTASGGR